MKKRIKGFSSDVVDAFQAYSWPGNIRELANTIERAAILEESDLIQPENIILPESIKGALMSKSVGLGPVDSFKGQEKEMILRALEESFWVQKDAAKFLGISSRVMNYKVAKYEIKSPRWSKNKLVS